MLPDISQRPQSSGACRRSYDIEDFEFRTGDDGSLTFEGVASVVDQPYTVRDRWGTFQETIRAGAFNKTLKDSKANVALLVSHQGDPLADRRSGTLQLKADPNLRVVATLDPADPQVQSVQSKINRGVMRQMSIGFSVPKARDEWNDDLSERIISEVSLAETSIVWKGANHLTSGGLRSFDDFFETITDTDMSKAELRRAVATLECRFADLYSDDVRQMLRGALVTRYNPSDRQWIWVRDFTDTNVVYELEGFTTNGTFRLDYSLSDTDVTFAGDPVAVAATTRYIVISGKRDDADPLALQAEEDWALAIRRKHPATV